MHELPAGTVTFCFTDVEGSTRLLHELGPQRYADALGTHRRLLRGAFGRHGGIEVDTQGDAFFYAFASAPAALAAAVEGQEALAEGPIRVRIGIHTGTPLVTDEGYVGSDVHKAARIASAGHGGQVLVSSSTAALVSRDALKDLGEHRLKDLSAPERIFQLGGVRFPPLKTLYRTNLPVPATPFVGRARELADISSLLAQDGIRLLTLTGPGGTGKTRLALHAAAAAAERFPDGVFWLALAPLQDSGLVGEEAARVLAADGDLAEHIADKRLLLLFDNFEHVIDAADELARLVAGCPNLRLLVTSRELLQLPGEQAYPVPPLVADEGVELFVARARAITPDFSPGAEVPELCLRLDNLPLAIELAAARVRTLSPAQLLERLSQRLDVLKAGRGVDRRQQTLRATIEWSYELLVDDEKHLFDRLAVFRGGCTLDAAEQICDADLDVLQALVDKSLIRRRDPGRFWMLETIREYADERLGRSTTREDLERRHCQWFLALVEEAEPHLVAGETAWFDRVDAEHDNLRAALDYLHATGDGVEQQRMAAALSQFWYTRGHLREGLERLERALEAADDPTPVRAKALNAAGVMSPDSQSTLARERFEGAHVLFKRFGDVSRAARARGNIGYMEMLDGNYGAAKAIFEENAATYDQLGEEHMVLMELRRLAAAEFHMQNYARNIELHEEIVRRAGPAGNDIRVAVSLCSLAQGALLEEGASANGPSPYSDRYTQPEALRMLADSIRLSLSLQYHQVLAAAFEALARALVEAGHAPQAAQVLAKADALFDEFGDAALGRVTDADAETRAMIRTRLDEAEYQRAVETGRLLSSEDISALAFAALDLAIETTAAANDLPTRLPN